MSRTKRKGSIIIQLAIMFAICVLLIGGITFISQLIRANKNVTRSMETRAKEIGEAVKQTVTVYPAYDWLITYWHDHSDDMDIEYDAGYGKETSTEEKCRLLESHCPDLQLKYADASDIESLSEEDQKLYAEIMYSWMLTYIDKLKESFVIDYLFCVMTNDDYDNQFFIFSGAAAEEKRGTEGEEVYPLGYTKSVTDVQRESMRDAELNSSHFAYVDGYVDYYLYLGKFGGKDAFIGLTFNEEDIAKEVKLQTAKGSLAAMGYEIILAVIISLGVYIIILKPMKKIQTSILLYKNTKDSALAAKELETVDSGNELGELAEDIVKLTYAIDEHVERMQKITAEKERIDTELALAERIQASMLPKDFPPFPDRNEFDIYAAMDPAREVGGDFFDFFLIDEDHLCLVMADVSGKGIPGALFMMISKNIIKNYAMKGISPAEILEASNEELCSNNDAEMFVTVWLGILEISTGRMTASNAGHEYPAIKKPGGAYEILKDKHGFVLGGMEGLTFSEYELQIEPGTSIFVYTDGVPEATSEDDELFGTERMIDALNIDPEADPEQILKNVSQSVDEFVRDAEQFDDLTMLCMRYNARS